MNINNLIEYLKNNFNLDILSIIENIDEDSVQMLSNIINLPPNSILGFCKALPPILRGEKDIKSLILPLLPLLLQLFIQKKDGETPSNDSKNNCHIKSENQTPNNPAKEDDDFIAYSNNFIDAIDSYTS